MNSLSAIEIKISELEEKNIHPWDKTIEQFFGKDYVFPSIDSISIPPDFDANTIIPKLKASKGKLQNNVFNGISNDVTVSHINKLPFLDDNGEYDKSKQIYNKYIDRELLRIREANDYRIMPEDTPEVKRFKSLTSQPKIPGANVLLPSVGLVSYDEETTPPLAREFKKLKAELAEIDKLLEAFEEEED